MRRVMGLAALAVVGLVGAAVVGTGGAAGPTDQPDEDGTERSPSRPATTTVMAAGAGLQTFDACDALTDHLRTSFATDPWAGDLAMMAGGDAATDGAGETAMDDQAPAPEAARVAGGEGTSDTNVQVAGVDELDLVETDGVRVFTVNGGQLHVVDVSGPVPTQVAGVDIDVEDGVDGELLLHEDRLLVVTRGWTDQPLRAPGEGVAAFDMVMGGSPVTTLFLFDVAGDEPVELGRLEVEGELVAGRGVDGTAHLVVAHRPQPLPMAAMDEVWSEQTEDGMVRRLQEQLATTTASDWLPALRHRGAGGVMTTTASVACVDVARPVDTDDTSMLQVMTIDTHGADVMPEATTGVLTDARSVTATATELVVATPVWAPVDQPQPFAEDAPAPREVVPALDQGTTRLHLFDLGPEGATHRASGEVPGMLLNQFSMSLHAGDLRVATTAGDAWAGTSESGVTVLRPAGDRLEVVGSVGGLGRGETIHAVRFLGDRAYVVTFRQTDPLYTIDLADPTEPEVTGELKITGYSAYLHPLGEGRLLGVGQEATLEGQTTGTQVSVFDVNDPANPTRVSQVTLPGANSESEWDHHAVLVHDGLVVLPYERWAAPTPDNPEGYESAAIVIEQSDDALRVRGTVASSAGRPGGDVWNHAVRRALVVDGRLVTISRSGVAVHDTATLDTTGELELR